MLLFLYLEAQINHVLFIVVNIFHQSKQAKEQKLLMEYCNKLES